jgi:sugar O-acyltransferase (sialic acid O-acetyltransferase NeuD family)
VKVLIIGAGGYALELRDFVLEREGWELLGFADAKRRVGERVGKHKVLCRDRDFARFRTLGTEGVLLGVGVPALRKALYEDVKKAGFKVLTLVHPGAYVAPSAKVKIGEGSVVYPGAVINAGVRIGRDVLVNSGVTIAHECRVGSHSNLNPGCNLAGRVRVGEGVEVGIGASVLQGLKLEDGCFVGGGAMVVRDVPVGVLVKGVPARSPEESRKRRKRLEEALKGSPSPS